MLLSCSIFACFEMMLVLQSDPKFWDGNVLMQSTRLVILQGQIYKTFIQVHYVLNSSELILEHHPLL